MPSSWAAAVVYFGLYPRPPVEAPLDPDTLYRGDIAVGLVVTFKLDPMNIPEQYSFQLKPSKTIEKGDVLRFRHATCFVVGPRTAGPIA